MDPTELLNESTVLLDTVLREARRQSFPNFRLGYIHDHAANVLELAEDILVLDLNGRIQGAAILARPALESLFCLGAAVKVPEFAAEKVVDELEYEISCAKKMLTNDDGKNADESHPSIKILRENLEVIRHNEGITGRPRWDIRRTAKAAELGHTYLSDYFFLSDFAHCTFSGLVSASTQSLRGLVLQNASFSAIAAASFVVQSLETEDPDFHIKEATRLIGIACELLKAKVFRDYGDPSSALHN